jgi:hypothetical protein
MPHFIGRWFPRSDIDSEREFYCASMLALLCLWRNLAELKPMGAMFQSMFEQFSSSCTLHDCAITENIQYQYDHSDRADMQEFCERHSQQYNAVAANETIPENSLSGHGGDDGAVNAPQLMEEDVKIAHQLSISAAERTYAEVAITIA